MEKYYLCERSIKEGVRGDQGPPSFTSVSILCSKLDTKPDPFKNIYLFTTPQKKKHVRRLV